MKLTPSIPILKIAKQQFRIDDDSINENGKFFINDHIELRKFTHKFNAEKDIVYNRAKKATPGELNALLIIADVIKLVISKYTKTISPKLFEKASDYLSSQLGQYKLDKLQNNHINNFIFNNDQHFLSETLLIWLLNKNRAFKKYRELFNDDHLKTDSNYPVHFELLQDFFKTEPAIHNKKDLISFLIEPMLKFPDQIYDQLNFIKDKWQAILGDDLLFLLQGLDLLKEENKAHFTGPGPAVVHQFNDEEYENFTADKDWMPHLVLIAKSTYVWLDQLSRKYKTTIEHLDQIPQAELELQASRGITGIWLIGIWRRSSASKRIKEINGDVDAIASAYSLDDYIVAEDLGGENALEILKKNAARVNLRIGCDMVPNHTGLDSKWIVEHPDWFLQLDHPPFPAYTFSGENLSSKNEIQVRIEDHYFEKSDAAVVFQYIKDGKSRYIYHGNDGTSTPWNDTAQLNYLLPEVRKAVSDKIIEIACKFPIIRFDAAMTLAKKHVQRLWFPAPGSGGDIVTRSEHGMSRVEFNKLFPNEFWREVVDRAAVEAPDTLLLAEAFWMMEGYFVRTLGMHRVYNSAFMNMLKTEENAKYRKSIFNVLEFNPEILKRFVNFMSNPDEDTAFAQFGKDDKYYGVCIMMSTMPGLPMFAHGQIEGYTERYGMEFKKAKWQENEDVHMIDRHNREIFPLLNKRYLFSEVKNFVLFDFINESGELNENVFAYTNRFEDQHSLVVYNNKFQQTSGWINWANVPQKNGDKTIWTNKNLASAWQLHNSEEYFVIFRDEISGLEFIRNSKEIHQKGLYQNLGAFKYNVFLNVYEVKDDKEEHYAKLAKYLQGGGMINIQQSLKRIELLPLLEKFSEFLNWDVLSHLINISILREYKDFEKEFKSRLRIFLSELSKWMNSKISIDLISKDISADLENYFSKQKALEKIEKLFVVLWILMRHLGKIKSEKDHEIISAVWLDELFFGEELKIISKVDIDIELLKITLLMQNWWKKGKTSEQKFNTLCNVQEAAAYLQINEYDDKLWFNKEAFEKLIDLLYETNTISIGSNKKELKKFSGFIKSIKTAEKKSKYQIGKLLENLGGSDGRK